MWRAQEQNDGWVSEPAIRYVAELVGLSFIRAYEVATFYTMFHLAPVGRKAHIQVCGTTPCWLRGANDIKDVCRHRIHHDPHHLSDSGDFSWEEVECLGACVNAPLVQIGADTFEDLTRESFGKLLDDLAAGRPVKPGPQTDRQFAAPPGGPTTLVDAELYAKRSTEGGEGDPLTDARAKKPTEVASNRESPVPKPPLAKNPDEGRS
jgi:NADH-quinone oxidoreductase subunit E